MSGFFKKSFSGVSLSGWGLLIGAPDIRSPVFARLHIMMIFLRLFY